MAAVHHWLLTGPVLLMLGADDSSRSLQWLCPALKAAIHSPFLHLPPVAFFPLNLYEMFPEPSGVV